ncbi:MAG TPA: response regulator transcription factor [Xanthobacteraceae bacterium]|nr:response regulator transcription factor [Xanthobacteraceae bacterium]
MRVLVIEDDVMVGRGVVEALEQHGMSVDWAQSGPDGYEALINGGYGSVLLDLGLPGLPGMDLLKQARGAGNRVPLLVITARDTLDERVRALDLGADDFLVKPFEVRELVARIRAVTRRHGGFAHSILEAGEVSVNIATHEVSYRGTCMQLPAREFALMQLLTERRGSILSRAQIEERLYGWGEEVESNAIDVLIHSIRRKFDKEIIRNVRGAGWMIVKSAT